LNRRERVDPRKPLELDLREEVCPCGGLDGGEIGRHEGRGDEDGDGGRGGLQEGRQREPARQAGSPLEGEEDASGEGGGQRQFGQGVQFGEESPKRGETRRAVCTRVEVRLDAGEVGGGVVEIFVEFVVSQVHGVSPPVVCGRGRGGSSRR